MAAPIERLDVPGQGRDRAGHVMNETRKDWLKWVAAGFALIATASAEYELARAIGMHPLIAAAVPGALDAYAVRALRAHREVLTAVLAMVAVNAASHLVTAGVLTVSWPLITAVSAIAPLVLWRVHALSTPGEARLDKIWGVSAGTALAQETSTPEHSPASEAQTCSCRAPFSGAAQCPKCEHAGHRLGQCLSTPPVGTSTPPVPEHGPMSTQESGTVSVPDYMPDEWSTSRVPAVREHGDADVRALTQARQWAEEHGELPSLRTVKEVCSVGTDRARRVLVTLKQEKETT